MTEKKYTPGPWEVKLVVGFPQICDGRCLDSLLWLVEQVQDSATEEHEVQRREAGDVE